jgi:hypothetical protein
MIVLKILGVILGILAFGFFFMYVPAAILSWIFGVGVRGSGGGTFATPDDIPNAAKFVSKKSKEIYSKLSSKGREKMLDAFQANTSNKVEQLEKLRSLKRDGFISEEDFEILKGEIIKGISNKGNN